MAMLAFGRRDLAPRGGERAMQKCGRPQAVPVYKGLDQDDKRASGTGAL